MQILMLCGNLILLISKCLCNNGKEAVQSAVNRACQTSIRADSPTNLTLTLLMVTSRPYNDKFSSLKWPNTFARNANIIINSSLQNWT